MNDKKERDEKIETTIDPYTGEEVPVPEDAHKFVEVVPQETDDREGQNYLLEEETSMDALAADENADEVAELAASYTEDKDIEEHFARRQQLAVGGRQVMKEELDEHNAYRPIYRRAIWMQTGREPTRSGRKLWEAVCQPRTRISSKKSERLPG
jgi:hypothetical protein